VRRSAANQLGQMEVSVILGEHLLAGVQNGASHNLGACPPTADMKMEEKADGKRSDGMVSAAECLHPLSLVTHGNRVP
jgi:hypothetical protein